MFESSMVRFRYGPWDFRYRRFINLLVAKGLLFNSQGNTIHRILTQKGLQIAKKLVGDEAFTDIAHRATLLKRHFDQRGTSLMRFIYNTFPEISTLRLRGGNRAMRFQFKSLKLQCQQSVEFIEFSPQITHIHGQISTGKSSIVRLIDYCLGGHLERTPAITRELVSVQLSATVVDNDILSKVGD